jgi:ribonuclease P protein component
VDDLAPAAPDWRLGVVVAKRFAPKAVTRNLVRRQARELLRQHLQSAALTPQSSLDVVIRTRAAVAPAQQYRSASSALLKKSVAADLKALLSAAPSLPTGV